MTQQDRKTAFLAAAWQTDPLARLEVIDYVRQHLTQRQEARSTSNVNGAITLLVGLLGEADPPSAERATAFLWHVIDHLNLEQRWTANTTTRPLLILLVQEAQRRQNLPSSTAMRSLLQPAEIQVAQESPRAPLPWWRRVN
jgi:hypothetical protein